MNTFETDLVAALPHMKRWALSMYRDAVAAEDAVQSTCAKALTNRDAYDPDRPLRPWLFAVMWNDKRSKWGVKQRLFFTDAPDYAHHVVAPESQHFALELKEALEMLDTLPPEQRSAVLLDATGSTLREIAAEQDVSHQSASMRAAQGRRVLARAANGRNALMRRLGVA